jgi:hypothetical protein
VTGSERNARATTTLRAVTAATLLLGCLVTVLVVGRFVGGVEAADLGQVAPLAAWLLLPYAALGAAARWLAVSRLQAALVLLGTVAATVVGLGVLVDALVIHPAFLNLLVLLAVPTLPWMVVLATLVVAAGVRWLEARAAARRPLTERRD